MRTPEPTTPPPTVSTGGQPEIGDDALFIVNNQVPFVEFGERRSLFRVLNDDVGEDSSLSTTFDLSTFDPFNFDPTSTLVGYISNSCGPRGDFALADLTQCEFGHEIVQFVPWQDDNVVASVDGCDYISFEIYDCLPPEMDDTKIDEDMETIKDIASPISYQMAQIGHHSQTTSTSRDEELPRDVASCKVVIANGSCLDPGRPDLILGSTKESEFVIEGMSNNAFGGKIVMIHDSYGEVTGCGTVDNHGPEIDSASTSSRCLCGCDVNGNCSNKDAQPHSLYLKLAVEDTLKTRVTLYFKPKEQNEPCVVTVNADTNGLFHIALPEYCQDEDAKAGIGTEVAIDYKGDERVDLDIDTSCSVPLYTGMVIEDSPFIIGGYCLSEDETSCVHMDQGQVCSD